MTKEKAIDIELSEIVREFEGITSEKIRIGAGISPCSGVVRTLDLGLFQRFQPKDPCSWARTLPAAFAARYLDR